MQAFDMTIQGKTYHVEIPNPGATPLQVVVDGEPFEVGIVGTQAGAEVGSGLPPTPASATEPAALPHTPRRAAEPRVTLPPANGGSNDIVAPMPGTVLSIAVKPDQRVEPGDVVCVLEAMKMKNPIRATHTGIVAEICVEAGATVPYGEVLIRLA